MRNEKPSSQNTESTITMRFDPDYHHRRSTRLRGYDYSSPGLYYVTICCKNKICLFGEISDGRVVLNTVGAIAKAKWMEIPDHFPNVKLHEYIVMPNHIHGILEITINQNLDKPGVGANKHSPTLQDQTKLIQAPFKSPSRTIGSIVRAYKNGVGKWMRQNTEIQEIWQRNFYDRIIRDSGEYDRIVKYIKDNPGNWESDEMFNR